MLEQFDSLKLGTQYCCAKFTHAFGGEIPSLHFIPTDSSNENLVQKNSAMMNHPKAGISSVSHSSNAKSSY